MDVWLLWPLLVPPLLLSRRKKPTNAREAAYGRPLSYVAMKPASQFSVIFASAGYLLPAYLPWIERPLGPTLIFSPSG
jgi:hypothetical protein